MEPQSRGIDILQTDWFAGLVDGEGCLMVHKTGGKFGVVLQLRLRADCAYALGELRTAFGGSIAYGEPDAKTLARIPGTNPWAIWTVRARADVLRLIEYFDAHPLRLKAAQYEVWRQAATLYYRYAAKPGGNPPSANPGWLVEAMAELHKELKRLKQYAAESRPSPSSGASAQLGWEWDDDV